MCFARGNVFLKEVCYAQSEEDCQSIIEKVGSETIWQEASRDEIVVIDRPPSESGAQDRHCGSHGQTHRQENQQSWSACSAWPSPERRFRLEEPEVLKMD